MHAKLVPANERPPQGLRPHIDTLTVTAFSSASGTKLSLHAFLAISPVQNSPNRPPSAALPRQNSPCSPKMAHFSGFWPCRASFVSPRSQTLGCWANLRTQQRWTNDHPPAPVVVGPSTQQTPENSHVIRLKEVSTNAENVAIPTRRIKDLKQSQENYVRNW